MTRTLYLVRHAESAMNVQPWLIGGRSNEAKLTETGIRQARELGRTLMKLAPFARVYSSTAVRTQETMRYALAGAGLAEAYDTAFGDDLQEMDQGDYVGRDRTQVYTPAVIDEIAHAGKDFALPGGESMNDVGVRMADWLARHEDEASTAPLLVFGHGLAIRCLASYLEGWSHQQTLDSVTPNASLSTFRDTGDGWRLVSLGRSAADE